VALPPGACESAVTGSEDSTGTGTCKVKLGLVSLRNNSVALNGNVKMSPYECCYRPQTWCNLQIVPIYMAL